MTEGHVGVHLKWIVRGPDAPLHLHQEYLCLATELAPRVPSSWPRNGLNLSPLPNSEQALVPARSEPPFCNVSSHNAQ